MIHSRRALDLPQFLLLPVKDRAGQGVDLLRKDREAGDQAEPGIPLVVVPRGERKLEHVVVARSGLCLRRSGLDRGEQPRVDDLLVQDVEPFATVRVVQDRPDHEGARTLVSFTRDLDNGPWGDVGLRIVLRDSAPAGPKQKEQEAKDKRTSSGHEASGAVFVCEGPPRCAERGRAW